MTRLKFLIDYESNGNVYCLQRFDGTYLRKYVQIHYFLSF